MAAAAAGTGSPVIRVDVGADTGARPHALIAAATARLPGSHCPRGGLTIDAAHRMAD
jgi:hypothetical protein